MFIRLNEQEVVDGICMAAADALGCDVTEVDVQEIEAKNDGDIHAHVQQQGRFFNRKTLHLDDIMEGIVQFYVEFHLFNPEAIVVRNVSHNPQDGFFAEVTVNE